MLQYQRYIDNLQANPHKRLRHLYGSRMMNQYRNVALGELSPHVYAIAEQVHNLILLHAAILKAVCCSHACIIMLTELCPVV